MAIFNSLEFDGVNSLDHEVFITGEAVYNTPERDVQVVEVPGRNGDIIIDKGRYKNIDVTYPAGAFGSTQEEFARKIRTFRNKMASRGKYKRLVDTYNPDEFRLGTFKDAVEVSPAAGGKAGEFNLIFNCKPQRWLMSGENEISVTSGEDVFNPTLENASPMLEVEGYGTVNVNGYEIEIENATLGELTLAENASDTSTSLVVSYDKSVFESGDQITVGSQTISIRLRVKNKNTTALTSVSVADRQEGTLSYTTSVTRVSDQEYSITWTMAERSYTAYTPAIASQEAYCAISFDYTLNGVSDTGTMSFDITRKHYGSGKFWLYYTTGTSNVVTAWSSATTVSSLTGVSTQSILGQPTYIDCDLGVCYKVESDTVIDLNAYIDLGSNLPVLSPGSNAITFDNTITSVKVIPRWWLI